MMRKTMMIFAAGTALLAVPAFAQLDVGGAVGGTLGAQVDPGATVGNTVERVTQPVGDTVDRVDGTVNRTADTTKLTLATREEVRAGVQVTDTKGKSIGTVQSIDGDNAVVVDGGKLYNVPLSSLYRQADGAAGTLVTKLPKAGLEARGSAEGETNADATTR
ncbi:MAG: hypothetical protein WA978_06840 [Sphingopyxis granuli]|uniref:hypothetical protein n=2 Tax=Sphingopyxis granuli TaxID=267128 RepID=UPI003C7230D7